MIGRGCIRASRVTFGHDAELNMLTRTVVNDLEVLVGIVIVVKVSVFPDRIKNLKRDGQGFPLSLNDVSE